ncbi:MAG: sulfurtransferase-like selenium metabolism protein YedF [Thermodesulfovibrionales bacterium]
METIDARGLGCPKPVILAEEALSRIGEGTVEVLVDNEASTRNLSRFAKKNAYYSETARVGDSWKVTIAKGYACEAPAGEEAEAGEAEAAKGILMVVSSDVLGKEEALGKKLMKGFFETMKVTGELPHTVFFLNAGVRLTTEEEDFIPLLKEIEALGVEIYSCGTCLDYFGTAGRLRVGRRGSADIVVGGFTEFQKVIWV